MLTFFNFLAAIAIMLYGIRSLRRGSERFFGSKLRRIMQSATKGQLRSTFAGILISILTPSSTAVALLSVEAVNAGYVALQQILSFLLGANIGFTLTVQLLAFKFYLLFSVFITLGVPLLLFARRTVIKGLGQALLGLGFILLAAQMLSAVISPLKNNTDLLDAMVLLDNHPVLLLLFVVAVKVLLQSATATIAIAIALTTQEVLSLNSGLLVVIGANLGNGVTALLVGYRQIETRRMALGNMLLKLGATAICLPMMSWLLMWLERISPFGNAQIIANAHTFFNLGSAIVFFPMVPFIARFVEKMLPTPIGDNRPFGAKYLDKTSLESPALALGQATREVLHMADHVRVMLRNTLRCYKDSDVMLCDEIQKQDDKVDLLNNEIKTFITQLSQHDLNEDESQREIAMLSFAIEMESAGDIVDKNLVELARKKITMNVDFSQDGWVELECFFEKVMENFDIAVSAFTGQDRILAAQLLRHKQHLGEWERELRNRHFDRLRSGLSESVETSAIHLDVLTNLKRINSHFTAVAYPILEANR